MSAWLALAAAAGALHAGWLSQGSVDSLQLCLFRRLTGMRCPGCGMGHSLLSAFQGRWETSFTQHPLGLPLLALWTFWLLRGLRNLRRERGFSDGFPVSLKGARGWALLAAVLVVHFFR